MHKKSQSIKIAWLWMGILAICVGPISARRYALLVGNNFGGPGLDSLHFSESDARRFADVLTRVAGFDPIDMKILVNCDSAGLEKGLLDMRKRLAMPKSISAPDGEDMFLFYYSGHSDRDALRLGGSHYPLDKLKESFQAVPSQIKIGIFDACQSGMMTRFSPKFWPPFERKPMIFQGVKLD